MFFNSPVLSHALHLLQEILPVFFFAIIVGSVLDDLLPEDYFEKFFKDVNFISILNSSILGALIPICTCGMIPLAAKLSKKGLDWKLITAFLVSGTACSIPALWLSTVLGYTVVSLRFVAAVVMGILVTYTLGLFARKDFKLELDSSLLSNSEADDCCNHERLSKRSFKRHIEIIGKDLFTMSVSFLPWLLFAILLASYLHQWVSNPFNGPLMEYLNIATNNSYITLALSPFFTSIIGFPFYFCAGADVPISSELLNIGVPLGSIISFMSAAPGVNLTSFVVYQKCIGIKKAIMLTLVSFIVSGLIGLVINFALA